MFLEICIGSGGLFITMHTWGAVISTSSRQCFFLENCPPLLSTLSDSNLCINWKRKGRRNRTSLTKELMTQMLGSLGSPRDCGAHSIDF